MAGSIKGIIVEIGGDTSGLQKALSKVNSATSSLSRELRGVNSLLKLDPKNTELLKQKQDILNESINTTQDKLKKLQELKEKADDKMASGTKINTENYRALQREIINTENKLKNLQIESSKLTQIGRKFEEVGTKIQGVADKVDSLGNKLTTRVTAPLVGLGIIGVKSAAEQEASMQQVELIYGEASDTIKDFAENTAITFNMSTKEAYKYSQIYGNLIQSITDDEAENALYTQQLLESSAIIASATGRTMEDVMDRIRSGLLGNTEAIEDLGINVNVALLESTDAFKKFAGDKSWEQLDFQTQQQIRLFGILEQTTKKYGKEVNKNTASSIQKLTAKLNNLTSRLNKKLLPIADKVLDKADEFIDKLDDLTDEEIENIIQIGLMVASIGPLIKILGTVTKTVGNVTKGVGILSQAVKLTGKTTTDAFKNASTATQNWAKIFTGLTSPVGIAAVGITGAVALIVTAIREAERETKESFTNMGNGASDFVKGIETAESHLDSFNSILFTSSEEQEKLQDDMDKIQEGITKICKKASVERRNYTQEEIKQLDEYFKKLRELKDRELEIQKNIAEAISQQAVTNAEKFQGSLDEYKVQSQEWIKTATEQRDATIAIIQDGTTQEVALLNQRYSTEESRRTEEYQKEYDAIMEQQQKKIDLANQEVAEVTKAYANGYLERSKENDSWYGKLQEHNQKVEEENKRHTDRKNEIENGFYLKESDRIYDNQREHENHNYKMKEIWKELYKNMDESQEEQLGAWLAQVAQTELYGGKLDEETKKIVDTILESYDSMPKGTKKAMKNAMEPMLEEMEKTEPSLFAKASSIADGILTRLKDAFDIHSPSRETRSIFKSVMQGAELGLEDEENKLYKQADAISHNLLSKFRGITTKGISMGEMNSRIVDSTKTIFTTPQIVFNVQELDEARLNQCFNYVNRKFGSQY